MRNLSRVIRALVSHRHPVLAQIIPMRQCNLACAYCNEYDEDSNPVPLDEVKSWIDKLATLRTAHITLSGGEPMLHPQLDEIIRHIRERNIIAGLITNGSYLNPKRITRLNYAGLEHLQISIDNLEGDSVSKKSLRTLEPKLRCLATHAKFKVNINTVVGGGVKNPSDAVIIAQTAMSLGFATTISIIHDRTGHLKPLSAKETRTYHEVRRVSRGRPLRRLFNPIDWRIFNKFQEKLVAGQPNRWRCRAGARYLYICEEGLVHYCSQQRGYPGIPIKDYTMEDFDKAYKLDKPCAPYCTIGCVQRTALLDNWRHPQRPSPNFPTFNVVL
jgi:MoaA/NifB/PqqE/SkfB family radical SAM enzyme